ncbi:MAG TPA: hypothetical protein VF128_02225, partial [Gemmatimonadaceae bacterium]
MRHVPRRRRLRHAALVASLFWMHATPATAAAQAQGPRLDFQDARLVDVIRSIAALAGLNVVLADIPDKRISFSTTAPTSPADLPRMLETVL